MTETMSPDEYRAELAKPKKQSESEKLARLFAYQCKARKLPEPRWKYGPGGELRFAADHADIPRQRRMKTKAAPGWKFDFAFPAEMIAVEIEGLIVYRDKGSGHMVTRGGHTMPQDFKDDCEKYAWAAVLGWRVIRFEQSQVRSGFAVDMLVRLFEASRWRTVERGEVLAPVVMSPAAPVGPCGWQCTCGLWHPVGYICRQLGTTELDFGAERVER